MKTKFLARPRPCFELDSFRVLAAMSKVDIRSVSPDIQDLQLIVEIPEAAALTQTRLDYNKEEAFPVVGAWVAVWQAVPSEGLFEKVLCARGIAIPIEGMTVVAKWLAGDEGCLLAGQKRYPHITARMPGTEVALTSAVGALGRAVANDSKTMAVMTLVVGPNVAEEQCW